MGNGKQEYVLDKNGDNVLELGGVSGDGKWIIGATVDDAAMRWSKETGVEIIDHPNKYVF